VSEGEREWCCIVVVWSRLIPKIPVKYAAMLIITVATFRVVFAIKILSCATSRVRGRVSIRGRVRDIG
jgi:hypothetical protein